MTHSAGLEWMDAVVVSNSQAMGRYVLRIQDKIGPLHLHFFNTTAGYHFNTTVLSVQYMRFLYRIIQSGHTFDLSHQNLSPLHCCDITNGTKGIETVNLSGRKADTIHVLGSRSQKPNSR